MISINSIQVGLASRTEYVPMIDGFLVKVLKESGAIILCKSNLPQIAMTFHSENTMFGTVKNPWN